MVYRIIVFLRKRSVLKALYVNDEIVTALDWSDYGLVHGDIEGGVFLWPRDPTPSGGLCHIGEAIPYHPHALAVSSVCMCRNKIISCSLDQTIKVIDPSDHSINQILPEITNAFIVISYKEASQVLMGTLDGKVLIYDMFTEELKHTIDVFGGPIISLSVHHASGVFTAISNKEVVLISLTDFFIQKRLEITADMVTGGVFATDGLSILVTAADGTIRVIDTVSFTEVGAQFFDIGELNSIAPIDYGKRYIVTSSSGRLGLFNLTKMLKEKGAKVTDGLLRTIAVQEEEMKVAVAGGDGRITLLDFD